MYKSKIRRNQIYIGKSISLLKARLIIPKMANALFYTIWWNIGFIRPIEPDITNTLAQNGNDLAFEMPLRQIVV